jgi:hypothetical protein
MFVYSYILYIQCTCTRRYLDMLQQPVRSLTDGYSEPAFANIRYIHGAYDPSSVPRPRMVLQEIGHGFVMACLK